MSLEDARLVPIAGTTGLVCRSTDVALLIAAREPAGGVEVLLERFRSADTEPSPAAALVHSLDVHVSTSDHSSLPPFALVGQSGDEVVVAAFGDVVVQVVEGRSTEVVSGTGRYDLVQRAFGPGVARITALPGDTPSPEGEPDPLVDVLAGVLAADGFLFVGAQPAEPPEPEPTFETVDLSAAAPTEALPLEPVSAEARVPDLPFPPFPQDAAICGEGHPNDPRSRSCARCGAPVDPSSIRPAPRPPLGVLVFDDGATWSMCADYVAGRQPEGHERVATGWALPLIVEDPERSISRVHAEIRLAGWDVVLTNLSTTNGSFLWDPTTAQWQALEVGRPLVLAPGARIALGRRTAVFESPVRR